MRAKLGHPVPFPLTYVEVGNEDFFDKSGSYEARFAQFFKAIKAKYPALQIIATGPLKQTRPDVVDDHFYKRADEFFDFVHHYDDADRNGPKIFIGEWATREGAPTTDMGAALGDAAWMTAMERNSDLIVMNSYAPMLVNVNPGGMEWESDLIGYNAERAYGSPGYYAQTLFASMAGDEVLRATSTGLGDRFFYSVTRDSAAKTTYVKLVNATSVPRALTIRLAGGHADARAELWTLAGHSKSETNSITDPQRIVPVKSVIAVHDSFDHTMPPYSIQILRLAEQA